MSCSLCAYLALGFLALIGAVVYKLWPLIKKFFWFSIKKWDHTPKDVLIVHCLPRGKCIPSPSPFVLKLETYLRMAGIAYEIDTEDSFGPSGKTPWISLNGTHVTDSQLIIEFLNKKFDKNLNGKLTEEQKALTRTIRIMLEEHAFWGLVHWRWIGGIKYMTKIMVIPPLLLKVAYFIMSRRINKALWAQGLGRLNHSDMVRVVQDDLRNVSTLLGTKNFIGGQEPCEDDCAVFGMLAEVQWAAHHSPYEKLLKEELPNLSKYCFRMKDKYWPDWDEMQFKQWRLRGTSESHESVRLNATRDPNRRCVSGAKTPDTPAPVILTDLSQSSGTLCSTPKSQPSELAAELGLCNIRNDPKDVSIDKDGAPVQPRPSEFRYGKYKYLEYSEQEDKVYCFICRHFSPDSGTSFVLGYNDWKNMGTQFQKHFSSPFSSHNTAQQKYIMYIQSKKTGVVSVLINSAFKMQVARNREVLATSVEVVLLCAQQEIALRGHRDNEYDGNVGNFSSILNLIREKCPQLDKQIEQMPKNAQYSSHQVQNEIISTCAKVMRRMIFAEINNELDCYSIICDESRDSAGKEQMSFCVRYLYGAEVKERFVLFQRLHEFDSTAITNAIKTVLADSGLNPRSCASQAYDGANVMSGVKSGVKVKIEELVGGHCPYIHCYAHRLNLVLVDSCDKIRDVRESLGLLQAIYSFQSNSVLRSEKFVKAQEELGYKPVLKMPQSCNTRWSSKKKGISYFKTRFDSVILALEHFNTNGKPDEAAECRGYLLQMKSFKTLFMLVILDAVLAITNELSEYLQFSELVYTRALTLCKSTVKTLSEIRTSKKFEELLEEAETIARKNDIMVPDTSTDNKNSRRKTSSKKLLDFIVLSTTGSREDQNLNKTDKMRACFFEIVDFFVGEMKRRLLSNEDILVGISAADPQSDNFLNIGYIKVMSII